jgi:hypothetical protein
MARNANENGQARQKPAHCNAEATFSLETLQYQAIRHRFALSEPVGMLIAGLAFGGGHA